VELRKLKRSRQGIDATKLNSGDVKRKKIVDSSVASTSAAVGAFQADEELEGDEAKARRLVRSNNFTQQTNALDVDKHMMAYIEENIKLRRGEANATQDDDRPYDPQEELFRIDTQLDLRRKRGEEGSVGNSLSMLTAIPEVDLGMDTRLKNIEDTEKAKRQVADERKDKPRASNDDLVANRFYRPNAGKTSDASLLRNAKLEAMGLAPEPSSKATTSRKEVATDEAVMERFKKRMRK